MTSPTFGQPSFDLFDDEPLDDPTNPTYTVGELADAINAQLLRGFEDGVWVRGEVAGFRNSGPHSYFTLVEHDENRKAVLNVSLFAPSKNRLTPLLKKHRLQLADGVKVRIFGQLDYYAPNGRLGLKMSGIDPRFTLGELSQARDQVVRRLIATGMYDANRRHAMPMVPLRIGVVTSVGTAAWHDFHNEIEASNLGFTLVVCDSRVQGDTAVDSVATAIGSLARRRDIDAIAVIRGGGARNELAVFDAAPIAVSIATAHCPVVTGLGHEIDRSVADDVAHTALKTPTAVARYFIDSVRTFTRTIEQRWLDIQSAGLAQVGRADTDTRLRARRGQQLTMAALARSADRLSARSERVSRVAPMVVAQARSHVAERAGRVALTAARQLNAATDQLDERQHALAPRSRHRLADAENRLQQVAARVQLVDPVHLLQRGWSITRGPDGRVVTTTDKLSPGTVLTTTVADGVITSRVEVVAPHDDPT